MKKSITTTYIDNWDDYDDEVWNAITEYTHEIYKNDGHIQVVNNYDQEPAFFIRSCKRLHDKDE